MNERASTQAARLARLGFADPAKAEVLLADPALAGLFDSDNDGASVLAALGEAPDPDRAVVGLVRLFEAMTPGSDSSSDGAVAHHAAQAERQAHDAQRWELLEQVRSGGRVRRPLFAVLGASTALSDHLVRHPDQWTVLTEVVAAQGVPADQLRAELLTAVGADAAAATPVTQLPVSEATDLLRIHYRRRVLSLAGRDLADPEPVERLPMVARELADLAAAALEAALAIARADVPNAECCRLAVIGMGKCGGRELNYVSDVDVIFVVEPAEGVDEHRALTIGTKLAAALTRICSASTAEGTLWPVDAALRPEGKAGPLVRTVASHLAYYGRWAQTWEFQALLKARVVAGDTGVGADYLAAIVPLVWRAAERDNFVDDVQTMRRRVEEHVPPAHADRQLKLGRGGLRDVEFSVQLLQLVHGRIDPRLRTSNTFEALEALSAFGYVGRDDAAELDTAYRFMRTLEHRMQLQRLTRTHVVPEAEADLRWMGRTFGYRSQPAAELVQTWRGYARGVRSLHEKLFYRPLLAAAAQLTTDEVRLTPEAAKARLAALGYRDPAGAMRHLSALTSGVSRRASIQRQLLPVMLGWFADGTDPDAGLLGFRQVSDELGTTHWYLKLLRDSGVAAERLANTLSASPLVSQLLMRGPEAVQLFGDNALLAPRAPEELLVQARRVVDRHGDDLEAAVAGVRAIRRRELLRTAVADLVDLVDLDAVGCALSATAIAAIDGALAAVSRDVAGRFGGELPTQMLIVGMGRLGGGELGYGSDADVMFVHDPLPGADQKQAHDAAMAVAGELRRVLGSPGPDPALEIDADLRPEGRNGPLVRTLDSYAEYYRRWSMTWEAQALTRAKPVAGNVELAERFVALIDPIRWPAEGLSETAVREIRRIKARVESERLPRGADPNRHLKLGRGGMSDVEWTIQLLQLQYAHAVPALRTQSTVSALEAAVEADLLDGSDAESLAAAWRLASRVRNATVLWRGRATDALPSKPIDLEGVSRLVGYPAGGGQQLDDEYQRITRRARAVVERVFYD